MGLTLSRRIGQSIVIGETVTITLDHVFRDTQSIKLRIDGPSNTEVNGIKTEGCFYLLMSRGETASINDTFFVFYASTKCLDVRLTITAPREVSIDRSEVNRRRTREKTWRDGTLPSSG